MKRPKTGALAALVAASFALLLSCQMPSPPADRYAILIGIADYPDPSGTWHPGTSPDLSYTVDDANGMAALLSSSGWTVRAKLTDAGADRAAIQTAITGLASVVTKGSSILVYYSGHGSSTPDNSTAFIIPHDGLLSSGAADMSKWITPADLNAWMTAVPCDNRILILDSCYSGGFVDNQLSVDAAPADYGPNDGGPVANPLSTILGNASALLAEAFSSQMDPSILSISAAGSQELSYDDGGHSQGAFTYWLLRAGYDPAADLDGNKLLTATEIYSYARAGLEANWNAVYADYVGDIDPYTGKPIYMDFMPRISSGSGDLVLYDLR